VDDVSFAPRGGTTWIASPDSRSAARGWPYLALAQVPCLLAETNSNLAAAPEAETASDPRRWLGLGVGADGRGAWRLLGLTVAAPSVTPDWTTFLGAMRDRGLAEPRVITSADSVSLSPALAQAAPAVPWQWCRLDATRALAAAVAPSLVPTVVSLLSSVFSLSSGAACQRRLAEVALSLQAFAPEAHSRLMSAEADLLGFISCPPEQWSTIWSGSIVDRLTREAHRRFRSVGELPDGCAALRIVKAAAAQAQRRGR
jgi:transposase-like protein